MWSWPENCWKLVLTQTTWRWWVLSCNLTYSSNTHSLMLVCCVLVCCVCHVIICHTGWTICPHVVLREWQQWDGRTTPWLESWPRPAAVSKSCPQTSTPHVLAVVISHVHVHMIPHKSMTLHKFDSYMVSADTAKTWWLPWPIHVVFSVACSFS